MTVSVLALAVLAAAAAPASAQRGPESAAARMAMPDGAAAGRVELVSLAALFEGETAVGSGGGGGSESGLGLTGRRTAGIADIVLVHARLQGLAPGFHGFHVHATGSCEGPSFTSAGGHYDPAGGAHPNHAGDLPVLHVAADGTATAVYFTDRFRIRELFDADGSAIIVHANADNYANIPTDRYGPDADATTLATGDAGGRVACGVVSRGAPSEGVFDAFRLPTVSAELTRSDGTFAGYAAFGGFAGKTLGSVYVDRVSPGFHGVHVHDVGRCERPTFASAGGHLNPTGAPHGAHAGDLPLSYVMGDRWGISAFVTERFRSQALLAGDGSAVVVHARPDNYANIPTDRYDPGPDATTLATGDAGDRVACGVVRRIVRCTVTVQPARLHAGKRTTVTVRVRSRGRPVRNAFVSARGAGVSEDRVANARGTARFAVRPRAAGRVRFQVDRDVATLGCATTRRVVGAGAGPALAGRTA